MRPATASAAAGSARRDSADRVHADQRCDTRPARPRLAIYELRKSTLTPGSSHRRRRDCAAHVDALGGTIGLPSDRYSEDVMSTHGFRRELEALLAAVVAGRYDGIVVWQLSDFGRNRADLPHVVEVLRSAACDLHVPHIPALSLFGPGSILIETTLGTYEREASSRQRRPR